MKSIKISKKKILPFLLVICISLLAEIFVFNFRSYESLFYNEKLMGEFESYVENDEKAGISSLFINTGGEKIHNIYLNMGFIDKQSGILEGGSAAIAVQDEMLYDGNPFLRPVTERFIMPEVAASQYVFFSTYGGTQNIRINFPLRDDKSLRLFEIKLNAHRPLLFSFGRFIIMVIAGLFILAFRKESVLWKIKAAEPGKAGYIALTGLFAAIMAVAAWWMLANPLHFRTDFDPYAELARAITRGETFVASAEDHGGVTDAITSIWNGTGDKVYFDHALYHGKYYVYFGILPCLIFYLPWHVFTGGDLPDAAAQLIQLFIFIPALHFLLREIEKRFFEETSFAAHLLLMAAMLCNPLLVQVVFGVRVYCVAILCGVNAVILGILFWLKAGCAENSRERIYMFLGSVCMASVSVARPTLLIFSFTALFIFWGGIGKIFKKETAGKAALSTSAAFILPYLVFAVAVMWYNASRFENPFEFGLRYNMTVFPPMNSAAYLPEVIQLCIYEFFFRLPEVAMEFPFFQGHYGTGEILFSGTNYYFETVGYGLFLFQPFLWILPAVFVKEDSDRRRKMRLVLIISMCVSLFLVIFAVAQTQTVASRYLFESVMVFYLAAAFLWLRSTQRPESKGLNLLVTVLPWIVLAQAGITMLQMFAEVNHPLEQGNPELFCRLFYLFHWY